MRLVELNTVRQWRAEPRQAVLVSRTVSVMEYVMRFKFKAGAAVALALALSGAAFPAFAADVIYDQAPEPPLPPQQTNLLWSGPYVGIYGGYNWLKADISPGPSIDGIDGLNGGAYAGWNWQLDPSWVVGLEGTLGINGAENSFGGYNVEQGWDASLRARLGYAFDSSMIYGLAGLAGTHAEVADATGSDSNVHLGWTIGAGLETMLTENVSARAEYNFSDYGSQEYSLGASTPDVSLDNHAIKVGIGLKF